MRGYSYLSSVVTFFDITILFNQILSVIIGLGIIVSVHYLLRRTWIGRGIRLVIQDRMAAELVGVNADRVNLYCFVLGFILAGVSGTLLSFTAVMTPFIGLPYTLIGLIVIIIGGIGSVAGTLIGAVTLGLAETVGVYLTSPSLRTIILYLVFIILVLIRPKGIMARK
jgi:branched-chain amino acid transport system permease protein